jgi:hypothetical protein
VAARLGSPSGLDDIDELADDTYHERARRLAAVTASSCEDAWGVASDGATGSVDLWATRREGEAMRQSVWLLAAALALAGACLAAPELAGAATFSNSGAITINDATATGDTCDTVTPGNASPYPSQITVAGLTGTVSDVNVILSGLTHTFPLDVDVLLVGPRGQSTILMAEIGGDVDINGVNLTFDDAAVVLVSPTRPRGSVRLRVVGVQRDRPERHLEPVRNRRHTRRCWLFLGWLEP